MLQQENAGAAVPLSASQARQWWGERHGLWLTDEQANGGYATVRPTDAMSLPDACAKLL